jgi:hypothetical protein
VGRWEGGCAKVGRWESGFSRVRKCEGMKVEKWRCQGGKVQMSEGMNVGTERSEIDWSAATAAKRDRREARSTWESGKVEK